jgi:processive 1,2-diacylglycerol beta-glucosyltransferase
VKAIILSASTGGGHMSAAKAIKEYFDSHGASADVIDALEYISPFLNKTVTEIYEYLATKQPVIWKMMYKTSNNKAVNRLILGTNSLISKKLLPLIDDCKPDIIITTHPFTTEMISKLKAAHKIDIPLICVMTDYAPHRTWINPKVNAYIVANEGMITPMIQMDVPSNKIYPFGIPVDDAFFAKHNKEKILNQIQLDSNVPTILIMAGSCGFANVMKIYRKLQSIESEFQVIIITGKNKKLYQKMQDLVENKETRKKIKLLSKISDKTPQLKHLRFLKKIKDRNKKNTTYKKTKIIYYTDEVDKYMWVSDLIITKPGGLTVSEALACNLPMALFDAIPGQEEENADFLVGNNMAVKLDSGKSTSEIIKNLLLNPLKLDSMKYSCESFDKSDSLKNIFNLVQELIGK